MKQQMKWLVTPLVLAGSLMMVGLTQAQPVTGDTLLDNLPPGLTALYGDWVGNTSDGPAGFTVSTTDTGGGSSYYAIPLPNIQTLNVNDTVAILTFTLNDGNSQSTTWTGVPLTLNDNVGAYNVGGYVGEFGYNGTAGPGTATWSGLDNNICTETMILPSAMIATIQAGGDSINGINLQFYPAVYPADGAGGYTVTFNSLTLSPVPEPTSMAMAGLGALGLLAFRRKK
jgi:hypothetical protein